MPEDKPRRAQSQHDRDRRHTPSSGAPVRVVDPPPIPGRTPTPQDVLSRRLAVVEAELKDNTRSTIRMEALLESFLGPLVKEQSAKLDTCLHHIAASSHIGANVQAMGAQLVEIGTRFNRIDKAQGEAAIRFEEHDARDLEIHALAKETAARVGVVEQKLAIADNTAKVRKLVARPQWWRAAWVKAIGLAVAGTIAAATAHYFGG